MTQEHSTPFSLKNIKTGYEWIRILVRFLTSYETLDITEQDNNYQIAAAAKKTFLDEDTSDHESNKFLTACKFLINHC